MAPGLIKDPSVVAADDVVRLLGADVERRLTAQERAIHGDPTAAANCAS